MSTDVEHPLEFLPELALGVLPAVDAAPVRMHMAGCESCRAEYEDMARVVAMLPLVVSDVSPSEAVKAGLMERIGREPQPIVRRPQRPRLWAAVAAAAAVLIAGAGLAGFAIGQSGGNEGELQTRLRRQGTLVQAAARGTMLTSEATNGDAWASLVRAPGATWGYVWVDGLPELPSGKAYQAWFTHDGKTFEPSATFAVSKGGVWVWAGTQIENYAGLGLTIEDAAGGKTPSADPFVKIALRGGEAW